MGRVEPKLAGLSGQALTLEAKGRLRFVVHAASWMRSMVLHGRCSSGDSASSVGSDNVNSGGENGNANKIFCGSNTLSTATDGGFGDGCGNSSRTRRGCGSRNGSHGSTVGSCISSTMKSGSNRSRVNRSGNSNNRNSTRSGCNCSSNSRSNVRKAQSDASLVSMIDDKIFFVMCRVKLLMINCSSSRSNSSSSSSSSSSSRSSPIIIFPVLSPNNGVGQI